jgi:hypothetical protein
MQKPQAKNESVHGLSSGKPTAALRRLPARAPIFLSVPYIGKLISMSTATASAYANLDPGIRQYRRQAIADADGNFTLNGLATDGCYVIRQAVWTVPNESFSSQEASLLAQRVRRSRLAAGRRF